MRVEWVREKIKEFVGRFYTGSEHVAGFRENVEAERIRGLVEELTGASSKLVAFPCISWRLKELSLDPEPRVASVAPYVEDSEAEGRVYSLKGDPSRRASWRGMSEGDIVLVSEPDSPDDLKETVLLAAENGASGVIVVPREEGFVRAIVTTGSWGYSYYSGSPTPIPVVYVDRGYPGSLGGGSARIYVRARTLESRCLTIQADLDGSGKLVIFGAHYDRWFKGFQDDIIGVVQAVLGAKAYNDAGGWSRLVLFSAEEHGAPGYASWYWSWGSRFYAEQLDRAGLMEQVGAYVNYDLSGLDDLIVSGSPQYVRSLGGGVVERCCECPECDSLSFAVRGAPTMSFHSLWSPGASRIYHTPSDSPDTLNLDKASLAVALAVKALSAGPIWREVESLVLGSLGRGPLMARKAAYMILAIAKRAGWEALYPRLAKEALKPMHYGSYRFDNGPLEAVWFPEVVAYRRVVQDLERGNPPREVWIAGEERLLYSVPTVGKGSANPLAWQLSARLRELVERIEGVQRELIS